METYAIKNLSFRYPETGIDVLKDITFSVNEGEFITVCGPSGCGKSTLLRHLKPDLSPHGVLSGEIFFEEKPISDLSHREQSSKIGFVMQSPENQIVTDKVWHELAFGLESLGYDNNTIRKRVAETASFFGIQNYFEKNVLELSGGQKQILNLASIMAMQPSVLILDEPTSQLDPIAASEFLHCVSRINHELGTTVIITEHRLDEVLPLSDRVLVIENNGISAFDSPQKVGKILKEKDSKTFLSMPAPMQIWQAVTENDNTDCPVTVPSGKKWLSEYAQNHKMYELTPENIQKHSDKEAVSLNDIWFRYEKSSADVLKGLSLKIYQGEFAAILGGNGMGKSTALSIICSLNKPYRGKVEISPLNKNSFDTLVAVLPQNPQTLFLKKTVLEDLYEVFDGRKISKEEKERRVTAAVKLCRLESLCNRHPYDLSGGEQQRAALAKILLIRPQILLLDEPTKGLDAEFKIEFAQIIYDLNKAGITVLMVSHDVEFCAVYPSRCLMFFNGEVVSEGTPRTFFSSNSFYSTSASRMSKGIIDNAVSSNDVIYACTGQNRDIQINRNTPDIDLFKNDTENIPLQKNKAENKKLSVFKKICGLFGAVLFIFGLIVNLEYIPNFSAKTLPTWFNWGIIGVSVALLMIAFGTKSKRPIDLPRKSSKLSKRTVSMAIMVLLAIPVTIFVGMTYLQDQKYLFISLLVMIECMIPFFLVFEGRHPKARELVIISVLCAIAVAGRLAFTMLPQFKPVVAIVIISGVAFGGESGFLVGAVSMLVSNLMFGQGPWTPWQMFAAGIIGFIGGILFKKGLLGRTRTSLCIYGFIATMVIYGGLMNLYSALTSHSAFNLNMLITFYVQGFPMDIVHAVSTVIFLFFGAEPMLEKLDRIKVKYGLIE